MCAAMPNSSALAEPVSGWASLHHVASCVGKVTDLLHQHGQNLANFMIVQVIAMSSDLLMGRSW